MKIGISRVLLLGLTAASFGAHADTETLLYSGPAFDFASSTDPSSPYLPGALPTATIGEQLTGRIDLSTTLAANGTTVVAPLDYSFSIGGQVVMSSDTLSGRPFANVDSSFSFTTVSGLVTDYDVIAAYISPDNSTSVGVGVSSTGGDAYVAAVSGPTILSEITEGVSSTSGHWTEASIAAPEMDPTSAAGALTLLAGGLVMLGSRRKQKAVAR